MQSLGSDLFIGLANDPGNYDGGLITRSANGTSYTTERTVDEQGIHDMQITSGLVFVPGTDPAFSDDWTTGNMYARDIVGTWTKHRTQPNVIHSLGLWYDGSSIFIGAGAHTGDNATWKGRVLRSDDGGTTWAAQVDVNDYRIYDVIGHSSRLYAIGYNWNGSGYTRDLHTSIDNGTTWSIVADVTPAIKSRMIAFGTNLVVAGTTSLYQIDASHTVTTHALSFTIANNWNVLATDGTYVYALDTSGYVWRTINFTTWTQYTYVPNAIAITYFTGTGLMIADKGTSARIWVV